MKTLLLAAGLLAAVAAGASGVRAAYLDYGSPDRTTSPYDDPRYRDLYGPTTRYTERREYEERTYKAPLPPHHVHRDDDEPSRYSEERRFGSDCLPRREVRRRLRDEGWRDFEDLELRDDTALLRARRPNGEPFDLKIDRCTGAVVSARPIERAIPGPFAYGPRRWARPYY